jgi:phosphopantetheine adenylyltransferase
MKKVMIILVSVITVIILSTLFLGKTTSKMEPGDKKKEEIKKFMDEKKTELKKVKFTLVGKFGELTQDKKVLQGVMDSAKAGDYAGLERILNSL